MAPSSLKGYWIHRPVPVIRNAGTAYAERRYQLGAVLTVEGSSQPIGISEYELSRLTPKELRGSLPTIEEIEAELRR